MILGFERLSGLDALERHRHADAHLTLVIEGSYTEAGDEGRWSVSHGDVLAHAAYSAHANAIGSKGALVLNLPVLDYVAPSFAGANCPDVDLVARIAERDLRSAAACLLESARRVEPAMRDWPDDLAHELQREPSTSITKWALSKNIAPERVSRAFGAAFGVSPKRFRFEARVRAALHALRTTSCSLAAVAADFGFTDQAHLSRAVSAFTGCSPGVWRKREADGANLSSD